jgi:3-isopropylmalate/(R)-2-methylmalate dehydratase large subunit
MTRPQNLYQKLCSLHTVRELDANHILLYVDLHVMNEYTSPQAFSGLKIAERKVWRPEAALAVVDHVNPTKADRSNPVADTSARLLIKTLVDNCQQHKIELLDMLDPMQGIEHVVVPEMGMALPGMVIVCGDSHTTTYGAFGVLGFGIGTSEVEHVLATQTLVYRKLRSMRVIMTGNLANGVTAKDLILSFIGQIGAGGASGFAIEFCGSAIEGLSMEGRMTICNMAVEAGARAVVIAPDETTIRYLQNRARAPFGVSWNSACAHWATLKSDIDAVYDKEITVDVGSVDPLVTWGTSPDQVAPISGCVPDPDLETDSFRRQAMERALSYMGLTPGTPLESISIDRVFIGSCTNSRIEDLRAAAEVIKGRRVAPTVTALVVPGSGAVRRQAEAEGIDKIFIEAGFSWRQPGCSMCLAMNDDVAAPGERLASSTNRNFEGRQGRGSRTHLMSPAMAAGAAVTGHLVDLRKIIGER